MNAVSVTGKNPLEKYVGIYKGVIGHRTMPFSLMAAIYNLNVLPIYPLPSNAGSVFTPVMMEDATILFLIFRNTGHDCMADIS